MVGEGKIHIVATQKQMPTDGNAIESEIAMFFRDSNQGKVACTTPKVADQDEIADLKVLPPGLTLALKPGIKSSQRFFEQGQVFPTSLTSSVFCPLTRDEIKGSRYRQH
jgi:hypothetical protein